MNVNESIGMKEKSKTVKNQTIDLLPEVDENLAKLEVVNHDKSFGCCSLLASAI